MSLVMTKPARGCCIMPGGTHAACSGTGLSGRGGGETGVVSLGRGKTQTHVNRTIDSLRLVLPRPLRVRVLPYAADRDASTSCGL
jgi:hypothetical protein